MEETSRRIRIVIEPRSDHPNIELVSGERLEAILEIPDDYPWHEPWSFWEIAEVTDENA